MHAQVTGSLAGSAQRAAGDLDPLSAALAADPVDIHATETDPDRALEQAEALVEEADRGVADPWLLSRAIALCAEHPANEALQQSAIRLIVRSYGEARALDAHRAMLSRFPDSADVLIAYLASLRAVNGQRFARRVMRAYLDGRAGERDADRLVHEARMLSAVGDEEKASLMLESAHRDHPDHLPAAMRLARHYELKGDYAHALSLIEPFDAPPVAAQRSRLIRARRQFGPRGPSGPPSVAAVEKLIEIASLNRSLTPELSEKRAIGAVGLIGSTLGGGGAERQLVATALGLHASASTDFIGPVTVYCRKLDRRRGHDFYLPALERQGIRVIDYLNAPAFGGARNASRLADHRQLLELLPHGMRLGTERLTDLLAYDAPEIVQLWQDGTIFAAGLAALLAGVPRIILNVRTLPPNQRRDRQRPEQYALYRGLLAAPGVTLTANSHQAAHAYERWLGLPGDSVPVVANGVDPLGRRGDEAERGRWQRFQRATRGGFTLGAVMRLDDNKRPLEFLTIAARLAAQLPDARFLLVGAGPLRNVAEEFARRHGIGDRTLFVGRTTHVGFWLEKMDALALTSLHEGLPNVLIEAQLAGVPVVTTPAGGAAEAVAPASANRVLQSAERPDAVSAADHLARLAARGDEAVAADSDRLRLWAANRFAMDAMIGRTLALFATPPSATLL